MSDDYLLGYFIIIYVKCIIFFDRNLKYDIINLIIVIFTMIFYRTIR